MTCVLRLFVGYWNVFSCPQYTLYTLVCTVAGSGTPFNFLPSLAGVGTRLVGVGTRLGVWGHDWGCGDTTGGVGTSLKGESPVQCLQVSVSRPPTVASFPFLTSLCYSKITK
jgi:hypothetical protein